MVMASEEEPVWIINWNERNFWRKKVEIKIEKFVSSVKAIEDEKDGRDGPHKDSVMMNFNKKKSFIYSLRAIGWEIAR